MTHSRKNFRSSFARWMYKERTAFVSSFKLLKSPPKPHAPPISVDMTKVGSSSRSFSHNPSPQITARFFWAHSRNMASMSLMRFEKRPILIGLPLATASVLPARYEDLPQDLRYQLENGRRTSSLFEYPYACRRNCNPQKLHGGIFSLTYSCNRTIPGNNGKGTAIRVKANSGIKIHLHHTYVIGFYESAGFI